MPGLLRSVWDEPRPPHAPVRVWRDWALAGALPVAAGLEGLLRSDLPWRVVSILLAVGLVPTLLWRRTRPLVMVAIAFGADAIVSLAVRGDPDLHTMAYLLLLPYALFRWGSGREMAAGSAILVAKVGLSTALGYLTPGNAGAGLLVLAATAAIAVAVRYRARARRRELEQIALLERERLARDLHDTVAHHVSAMAVRAQAGLATMASRPDAAAEALRVIEAEATRALAEMRTMVRALRHHQPAELGPEPRIGDLARLAGEASSGPVVDVDIQGDLDNLPPAVGTTIYRLAQESVTNARRHARHATRIEVRVAADDTSVRLRVSDDGEAATRPPGSVGYGIVGMTERAGLLGGTCEAGPNPDRGWTVTAVLPRAGVA
jgi:signal transduction histidine kinase